jgi:predicted regulator of Ras-like GTPase activity (Roadblock/LC7/MglB family)
MATQSLLSLAPPVLDHRVITPLLDELAREHAKLTGFGGMKGILLVDQDAKVIAKNSMFGLKKPWDMGGIAAALHGVARQASQYFGCSSLDRVAITFGNMQFFVQAIGNLDANDGRPARELLLVILADEKVKMGIVLVQMKKIAPRIVEAIRKSAEDMALIKLDERSVREYLIGLKTTS